MSHETPTPADDDSQDEELASDTLDVNLVQTAQAERPLAAHSPVQPARRLRRFAAGLALAGTMLGGLTADGRSISEHLSASPVAEAPSYIPPEARHGQLQDALSHAYNSTTHITEIHQAGVLPSGSTPGNEHGLNILAATIATSRGEKNYPGVTYTEPVLVAREGKDAEVDGPALLNDEQTPGGKGTSLHGLRYVGASSIQEADSQHPTEHINLQVVAEQNILRQTPRQIFDIFTTAEASDPEDASRILQVRHYAGSIRFATTNGDVHIQLLEPGNSNIETDALVSIPR